MNNYRNSDFKYERFNFKTSDCLAIFDFDGTITSKDSFLEFIKFCHGPFNYFMGLIRLVPSLVKYYLKNYSNHRLKEDFFSCFFKGDSFDKMAIRGKNFGENVIPQLCYQSALDLIFWHKKSGHDILILTASSDIWLGEWCKLNGFALLCTEFEVKEGHYSGKIKGLNCYGIQKKNVLSSFLSQNPYKFVYGYGDNKADTFFLKLTDLSYIMRLNDQNVKKLDYCIKGL